MRLPFKGKPQFISIITHPLFLGTIIWAGLYFSFSPKIEKYQVRLIENVDSRGSEFFYQDIDGDKFSEIIRIDSKDSMQTKVLVYSNSRIIDQFNLHYSVISGDYITFFDYDKDRLKEIAIFTRNEDSIFLNILNPLLDKPLIIQDRFVDLRGSNEFSIDNPFLIKIDAWGIDNSDLFFGINSGYSRTPRNLYRYNISKDSLIKSPQSGSPISRLVLMDMDGDSVDEIIVGGMATGNFTKEYPFSDQFAWLMAYDRDLEFFFPPMKLGNYPSHVFLQPIYIENESCLALFYEYIGTEKDSSAILIVDKDGQILKKKNLESEDYYDYQLIGDLFHQPDRIYFFNSSRGQIRIFDSDLNLEQNLSMPENSVSTLIIKMDRKGDGERETFLFFGDNLMLAADQEFKSFAKYEYPRGQHLRKISRVKKSDKNNLIYLQYTNSGQIVEIVDNPFRTFQIPLLVISWFGISFLMLGIFQIQRYRLTRIQEQEKRISTLQMRAIKNQLDPHFTFNIINAMGGLYLSETNQEVAYEIFVKYAKLLRQNLMSSQNISISLNEELEMVGSYLDIEKLRKDYSFEYKLDIDESVDRETTIPRMLIYTFVENAIKHGIRSANDDEAFIHIIIRKEKKGLKIYIENSGPGLNNYSSIANGTGLGLNILKEMAELYEKLEGKKISIMMKNLLSDEGKIRGVQGEVFLTG